MKQSEREKNHTLWLRTYNYNRLVLYWTDRLLDKLHLTQTRRIVHCRRFPVSRMFALHTETHTRLNYKLEKSNQKLGPSKVINNTRRDYSHPPKHAPGSGSPEEQQKALYPWIHVGLSSSPLSSKAITISPTSHCALQLVPPPPRQAQFCGSLPLGQQRRPGLLVGQDPTTLGICVRVVRESYPEGHCCPQPGKG